MGLEFRVSGLRGWCWFRLRGLGVVPPTVEHQMEEKIEMKWRLGLCTLRVFKVIANILV